MGYIKKNVCLKEDIKTYAVQHNKWLQVLYTCTLQSSLWMWQSKLFTTTAVMCSQELLNRSSLLHYCYLINTVVHIRLSAWRKSVKKIILWKTAIQKIYKDFYGKAKEKFSDSFSTEVEKLAPSYLVVYHICTIFQNMWILSTNILTARQLMISNHLER